MIELFYSNRTEQLLCALAGKVREQKATTHPLEPVDHPRTCGEHGCFNLTESGPLGSPPHMRGTLITTEGISGLAGITPAHAGNTY